MVQFGLGAVISFVLGLLAFRAGLGMVPVGNLAALMIGVLVLAGVAVSITVVTGQLRAWARVVHECAVTAPPASGPGLVALVSGVVLPIMFILPALLTRL